MLKFNDIINTIVDVIQKNTYDEGYFVAKIYREANNIYIYGYDNNHRGVGKKIISINSIYYDTTLQPFDAQTAGETYLTNIEAIKLLDKFQVRAQKWRQYPYLEECMVDALDCVRQTLELNPSKQ